MESSFKMINVRGASRGNYSGEVTCIDLTKFESSFQAGCRVSVSGSYLSVASVVMKGALVNG